MEWRVRALYRTNQFKRDARLAQKTGACALGELQAVVNLLRTDATLPPHLKDHSLKGAWKPARDCHVKPDLVLIYAKFPGELHLLRLGSHSELFGR